MDFSLDATKMLLILIILSLLGLNVFFYLAQGTDMLGLVSVGTVNTGIDTAKEIVKNTNQGASQALDTTKSVLSDGLSSLEKALDIQIKHQNIMNNANESADQSDSTIQTQSKRGVSGYCFVGTDQNGRNCMKVGRNQTCMSGDIFPTMDICVNPNLRT